MILVWIIIFSSKKYRFIICSFPHLHHIVGWKYFGFYSTTEPVFVSLDLEILRCIMTKDFNHFSDRGEYYNEKDDPICKCVYTYTFNEVTTALFKNYLFI